MGDRAFALAAAVSLLAAAAAGGATPVELSDVAAGSGGFVINGIDSRNNTGNDVSGAGDVNGDGFDDVIVAAYRADPAGNANAGQCYVVFGKADGMALNLSDVVAGIGGFVINGIDPSDYSGWSVSGAGDVNGDLLDDVIVGAIGADPPGQVYAQSSAGESYVVFGKADGTSVNLSDIAAGIGGFVINGIDRYDRSGYSVSGAGDVNGDGLADVIVGAHGGDVAGNYDAGESYVVFGKASGTAVNLSDVAAGIGGFVINGIDPNDGSGFCVSGAGDVNADLLDDVIVGARNADPAGHLNAGESYVVFGKANGTAVNLSDVVAGTGGFVINGIDTSDYSGWSVSGAGDVNGDLLDDVIVGAAGADPAGHGSAGESYVVFGKADGAAVNLSAVAAGAGGFVINGIDPNDYSGRIVSGAGDVNGDSLADVIVGAYGADVAGNSFAGESYVVFGKADGTAVGLADVTAGSGGFVINGIDPNDYSGWNVSGAGDVNGDGLADLIVGAMYADPGGIDRAGASYVVFSPFVVADQDNDGVADGEDNCPAMVNSDQLDSDGDDAGDICDVCPADAADACNQQGSAAETIPAADGGTIETPDGNLTMDIPPDALPEDTTISVTAADTQSSDPPVDLRLSATDDGEGQVLAEYDFQPDGLTFDPPITVTILADVMGIDQGLWDELTVYSFDTGQSAYVPLGGAGCTVDEQSLVATCTMQISHFSRYAVAAPADTDHDGLPDLFPPVDEATLGTNPSVADTDGDGLLDGVEVDIAGAGGCLAEGRACPDPTSADSDCDTLPDGAEVGDGTNSCNADTDGDGVGDQTDPTPTVPGVTAGFLEAMTRGTANSIDALALSLFIGPNDNARKGRRNALANRVREAANAIAAGDPLGALDLLLSALDKVDAESPPPDWMLDTPERQALETEVELLIALVILS